MREVSGIAVDHVVIQSSRSYEAVKTALEQRLEVLGNTWMAVGYKTRVRDEIVVRSSSSSGHAVSVSSVRSNGGQLLSLAGKRGKTVRYAIGLPEGSHGPYGKRAENLRRAI
jgi:hypothetical protein